MKRYITLPIDNISKAMKSFPRYEEDYFKLHQKVKEKIINFLREEPEYVNNKISMKWSHPLGDLTRFTVLLQVDSFPKSEEVLRTLYNNIMSFYLKLLEYDDHSQKEGGWS